MIMFRSPLAFLNFFLLQWICIRLGRVHYMTKDGWQPSGWTVLRYIVPLTGWWSDFIWIRRVNAV